MERAVIVKGKVTDSRHIELDEPVEEITGDVEVTVRPLDRTPDEGATDIEAIVRIQDEWRAKHPDRLRSKEDIDRFLAEEREAGEVFCISDLVRLECLVGPIRDGDAGRRAVFEAQFRAFRRLALTRAVFDLAAELRATQRLRTPDALHAACAMVHGCRELWTNDRRLAVLENRLGTRVLP
jgi:uncharacterized protein